MAELNKVTRAVDIIGNQREIVAFLRDVIGSPAIKDEVTPDGFEGLSRILGQVNDDLMQASKLLQAQ